jgi:hypothetical protein
MGKTQIAMEYSHRFAGDHDVVWWISAEQRTDTDVIAARLGDPPLAVGQAVAWLATTAMNVRNQLHVPAERWLGRASPAAALPVELCAFLVPEPIPTGLLDSPGTIDGPVALGPTVGGQLMHGSLFARQPASD